MNDLKLGDIIKHRSSKDVAFRVGKEPMKVDDGFKITGLWLNQAFVKTFIIDIENVVIHVKEAHIEEWFICKNSKAKCIRYEQWQNLTK